MPTRRPNDALELKPCRKCVVGLCSVDWTAVDGWTSALRHAVALRVWGAGSVTGAVYVE